MLSNISTQKVNQSTAGEVREPANNSLNKSTNLSDAIPTKNSHHQIHTIRTNVNRRKKGDKIDSLRSRSSILRRKARVSYKMRHAFLRSIEFLEQKGSIPVNQIAKKT